MLNRSLFGRPWQVLTALLVSTALFVLPSTPGHSPARAQTPPTYTNPITSTTVGQKSLPEGVQSCAQPSVIHSQTSGDTNWYLYCTTDALNNKDTNSTGGLNAHLIPMLSSADLVHWTYESDAFKTQPSWVKPGACMIAPEVHYFNNQYYLYYTACDTVAGGSAVGVATSASPLGPWKDSGKPVVAPEEAYCCAGSRRPMDNPSVITDDSGQKWIYYGGVFGGITVRKLSADGLTSDPATARLVAIDNKWEGAFAWVHNGYIYLFLSAAGSCCNGELSGYDVVVGRSKTADGDFVDQTGHSLMDARAGGTPVLAANGNRWVGPGANSIFTDAGGQDWTVYEAVDRTDPYFAGTTTTKRPALLDPVDWINDWPQVRGGNWASDTAMPAPAAQTGQKSAYTTTAAADDKPGALIKSLSQDFTGKKLGKQWHWVRNPGKAKAYLLHKQLNFVGCDCDLYEASNTAPVLYEKTPSGDYIVETKVKVGVPSAGCCFNYIQTGLVIYGDDDNFIKLVHDSVWNTRQTEFAKEIPTGPKYGSMLVGPPSDWTWLRIVKTSSGSEELYRAYTSDNGKVWVRGGVWTHTLGANAKIGLVSMGGAALNLIKYVHVYKLK